MPAAGPPTAAERLLDSLRGTAERLRAAALAYADAPIAKTTTKKKGKRRRRSPVADADSPPSLAELWARAWGAEGDVTEHKRQNSRKKSIGWAAKAGGVVLLIGGQLLAPVDAQERTPFLQLPEPDCEMDKATAIMQDTNAACDAGFATNQCDAPCALQMAALEYGECTKTITGIVDQQDRVPNGLAEKIDTQWARCMRVPVSELVALIGVSCSGDGGGHRRLQGASAEELLLAYAAGDGSVCALLAAAPSSSGAGRIYIAGGFGTDWVKLDSSAAVDANGYTVLPSPGTSRSEFGMGRLGDLVCAVGGSDGLPIDSCECLDTRNPDDGWSAMASLRVSRFQHAVASTWPSIGANGEVMCAIGGQGEALEDTVECYSQNTGAWSLVPSLGTGRASPAAAAIGSVIYVVGGGYNCGGRCSSVEALDLGVGGSSRGWVEKAEMSTARTGHAMASSSTRLFVVGGFSNDGRPFDTLEIYDSTADSWSTGAPMPTASCGLAAAIVGNTLFALGGTPESEPTVFDVVQTYDIEAGTWTTADPMSTPRTYFAGVAGPGP